MSNCKVSKINTLGVKCVDITYLEPGSTFLKSVIVYTMSLDDALRDFHQEFPNAVFVYLIYKSNDC